MPSSILERLTVDNFGRRSDAETSLPTVEWTEDSIRRQRPTSDLDTTRAVAAHRFAMLLDDPVLDLWASETADRYGLTPLDALEALARALNDDAPMDNGHAVGVSSSSTVDEGGHRGRDSAV